MYVPKMTEAEIYGEFLLDEDWVLKTYVNYNHPYNLKIISTLRKNKKRSMTKISRIKTPRHNDVLLISTVDRIEESVSCYIMARIPTEDSFGMYATLACLGGVHHMHLFTDHFFKRYEERMSEHGYKIKNPVMDFLKRNDRLVGMPVYNDEYENAAQFAVNDGIVLGNYRTTLTHGDDSIYLFDMRTFIFRDENVSKRIQYADNELLRNAKHIINK